MHNLTSLALAAAASLLASTARAQMPEIPEDKQMLRIEHIPGKLGAVFFAHAEHIKKGDGTSGESLECFRCHHDRKWKRETTAKDITPCHECHVSVGEQAKKIDGKVAPPLAELKQNGAVDHSTVLYHAYCRDSCHRKIGRRVRGLTTCRACHERGISAASIGMRYDEVQDKHAGTSWLTCPSGQRFTVDGCVGEPKKLDWRSARSACPEGFVIPERNHFLDILGRCDKNIRKGDEGKCRPCSEGARCSSLFPLITENLWTDTDGEEDGSAAYTVNLRSGQVDLTPKSSSAAALCIRDSFPSEKRVSIKTGERRIARCSIYNATDTTFMLKSGKVANQKVGPNLNSSIAAGIITGTNEKGAPVGGSCADGDNVVIIARDGVFLIMPR